MAKYGMRLDENNSVGISACHPAAEIISIFPEQTQSGIAWYPSTITTKNGPRAQPHPNILVASWMTTPSATLSTETNSCLLDVATSLLSKLSKRGEYPQNKSQKENHQCCCELLPEKLIYDETGPVLVGCYPLLASSLNVINYQQFWSYTFNSCWFLLAMSACNSPSLIIATLHWQTINSPLQRSLKISKHH